MFDLPEEQVYEIENLDFGLAESRHSVWQHRYRLKGKFRIVQGV